MNVTSSGPMCDGGKMQAPRSVTHDAIAEIQEAVAHNNTHLIEMLTTLDALVDKLHGPTPPQAEGSGKDPSSEGALGQLALAIVNQTRLIENIQGTVSRL